MARGGACSLALTVNLRTYQMTATIASFRTDSDHRVEQRDSMAVWFGVKVIISLLPPPLLISTEIGALLWW